MRQTPLRKVGKKRQAAIDDGTYVKPVRAPMNKRGPRAKKNATPDASWRAVVKERANGLCQAFGCVRAGSECHHLFTKAARPELRTDPRNGVFLCVVHHTEAHRNMKEFRRKTSLDHAWFDEIYDWETDRPIFQEANGS